jgi:hypothetical protein
LIVRRLAEQCSRRQFAAHGPISSKRAKVTRSTYSNNVSKQRVLLRTFCVIHLSATQVTRKSWCRSVGPFSCLSHCFCFPSSFLATPAVHGFVAHAHGVGGVVHGEIAQRCKYLFALQNGVLNNTEAKTFHAQVAQWLLKYEGSVLAGSFMPDW